MPSPFARFTNKSAVFTPFDDEEIAFERDDGQRTDGPIPSWNNGPVDGDEQFSPGSPITPTLRASTAVDLIGACSPARQAQATELAIAATFSFFFDYVMHNPLCATLFRCGCTWPWAGAAAACNVHTAVHAGTRNAKCPWCDVMNNGMAGFALLISQRWTVGLMTVTYAGTWALQARQAAHRDAVQGALRGRRPAEAAALGERRMPYAVRCGCCVPEVREVLAIEGERHQRAAAVLAVWLLWGALMGAVFFFSTDVRIMLLLLLLVLLMMLLLVLLRMLVLTSLLQYPCFVFWVDYYECGGTSREWQTPAIFSALVLLGGGKLLLDPASDKGKKLWVPLLGFTLIWVLCLGASGETSSGETTAGRKIVPTGRGR